MFLQKAAELKPDLVLYAGDTPPHHLWYEELHSHMNASRWLGEAIQRNIPGVPAFPAVGNHDPFPANMYYVNDPDTTLLHTTLINAYPSLNEESAATMHNGGYYLQQIEPSLRLLTYNTNFGYSDNFYNILAYSEENVNDMKKFVADSLASARSDKVKVMMMGHHPARGGLVAGLDDWVHRVCTEFGDVIVLHVAGHTHTDLFHLFQKTPGAWANSIQFTAPSSNPYENVNPSIRVYELDSNTHQLLDYQQFRMDMSTIGSGEKPEIKLAYRASEEFNLSDMSPKSWHRFAIRMLSDNDLVNKYQDHSVTGVAHDLRDWTCKGDDQSCRNNRYCKVTSTTGCQSSACNSNELQIPDDCVRSCTDVPNGNYQSCRGCNVFVTCTNGYIHDSRPCATKTVWDDDKKQCQGTSNTCF